MEPLVPGLWLVKGGPRIRVQSLQGLRAQGSLLKPYLLALFLLIRVIVSFCALHNLY